MADRWALAKGYLVWVTKMGEDKGQFAHVIHWAKKRLGFRSLHEFLNEYDWQNANNLELCAWGVSWFLPAILGTHGLVPSSDIRPRSAIGPRCLLFEFLRPAEHSIIAFLEKFLHLDAVR